MAKAKSKPDKTKAPTYNPDLPTVVYKIDGPEAGELEETAKTLREYFGDHLNLLVMDARCSIHLIDARYTGFFDSARVVS